ncbi:Non-LTR retroelement reverse transcriptase [Gossypium australe]|uniref:Non-LTR retroelement reverse transcriptase n=1 Tax=Gossypium australe TaxID=47621 RepID=A0A5B6VYE4_9ROSI|nr:Non-LTR retroelement reverse transcriptase [Gossypium australe]
MDQNDSFLLKLGFNFLSNKQALWVCFLRAKYKIGDDFPIEILKNQCSFLWRSFAKIWPLMCQCVGWSVGDGNRIKFWTDNWVVGLGPLINFCHNASQVDKATPLREMMSTNDVNILSNITSISVPNHRVGPDTMISQWSSNGTFSIKYSYNFLRKICLDPQDEYWKLVWSFPGPQHEHLLTNDEQCRRGMSDNPSCKLCDGVNESVLHSLRDYCQVRNAWEKIIPSKCSHRFFSLSLRTGLLLTPWDVKDAASGVRPCQANTNSGLATLAARVRDEFGNWISGIGRIISSCSVEQAELWAIYDGLSMAWDAQWRDVIVKSDCALVIKGINGDVTGTLYRDLIIRI